jgi:hypothetical protein
LNSNHIIDISLRGCRDARVCIACDPTAHRHEERRLNGKDISLIVKAICVAETKLVSTSYVERLNATTRLHMRRLTRLTLAFSKKRVNFEAAVGLHFAYYNFVKRHNTLRCTPAMAAGVAHTTWSVGDLALESCQIHDLSLKNLGNPCP